MNLSIKRTGFEEPSLWSIIRCIITIPQIAKGKTKCRLKKRFNVGLSTEKPPQSHVVIVSPIAGIALNKLVITVAPQKLICPQGNT